VLVPPSFLCDTHNILLSRFDTAGKEMFQALDALNEAAGNPAAPRQTLPVDGDGLERWMLKSLIGGLYSGNFRVTETETMKGVCPPPDLLEILFKGAAFPPGQGLYWMPPNPGEVITAVPQILRVAPLVGQGDQRPPSPPRGRLAYQGAGRPGRGGPAGRRPALAPGEQAAEQHQRPQEHGGGAVGPVGQGQQRQRRQPAARRDGAVGPRLQQHQAAQAEGQPDALGRPRSRRFQDARTGEWSVEGSR
jgi:hypothetical protein